MRPVMIVVAGPPGSGKSTAFPVSQAGVDYFNVDDRCAMLNAGSYRNITPDIRAQAGRVAARAEAGGHAAPPAQIRAIHEASLKNLAEALDVFERVRVYDNTALGVGPRLVLEARRGRVTHVVGWPPAWLRDALRGTAHERALPSSPDLER